MQAHLCTFRRSGLKSIDADTSNISGKVVRLARAVHVFAL